MITSVYTLTDPREPAVVRYVGKTGDVQTRLAGHVGAARKLFDGPPVVRWIRELLNDGVRPTMTVISEHGDESWADAERQAIADYRAGGHPLCNVSKGGECGGRYRPEQLIDVSRELWAAKYESQPFPLDWQEAVIIRMYRLGWTWGRLARSVGASRTTLHRYVIPSYGSGQEQALVPIELKKAIDATLAAAEDAKLGVS